MDISVKGMNYTVRVWVCVCVLDTPSTLGRERKTLIFTVDVGACWVRRRSIQPL